MLKKWTLGLALLIAGLVGVSCGGNGDRRQAVSGVFGAQVTQFEGFAGASLMVGLDETDEGIHGGVRVRETASAAREPRFFKRPFDGMIRSGSTYAWHEDFGGEVGTVTFVGRMEGGAFRVQWSGKTSGSVVLRRSGDYVKPTRDAGGLGTYTLTCNSWDPGLPVNPPLTISITSTSPDGMGGLDLHGELVGVPFRRADLYGSDLSVNAWTEYFPNIDLGMNGFTLGSAGSDPGGMFVFSDFEFDRYRGLNVSWSAPQ